MPHQEFISQYSYYKTGGHCKNIYFPENTSELQKILKELHSGKSDFFLLGAGTNSLVMDTPWHGSVISFMKMKSIEVLDGKIRCEAGVENSAISECALNANLGGAEWMNKLPGQIGATVRMNARCYGGEISQIVKKVHCFEPNGHEIIYENDSQYPIFKGYKDTIFMGNKQIIAYVELELKPGNFDDIKSKMDFCQQDRNKKNQFIYPSCGCIFKNNYQEEVSVSSGLLLELSGATQLKGLNCMVSPYHSNFIYNTGHAKSHDILDLSFKMRDLVWDKFGVWLEYEMEILGSIPTELKGKIFEKREHQFKTTELTHAKKIFQAKIKN